MRLPFPFCILCLLSGTGGKQPQTDNAYSNDASVDHNRKSEGKLDLKMERDGGIMEESSLFSTEEPQQETCQRRFKQGLCQFFIG